MRRRLPGPAFLAILIPLFCLAAHAEVAAAERAPSIPTGKGLPVQVRVALFYTHIEAFDDNQSTFEATTDLRLTWEDPRLRYPAEEGLRGYKEYRISAADAELTRIWSPGIRFINRLGDPSFLQRRLRIFPDGTVELILRTTALYKTPIDVVRFPFDHQPLQVEIAVEEETIETVNLIFRRDDVDFTRASRDAAVSGWKPGLVNLQKDVIKGWNGDRYAKVIARLDMQRVAGNTVATIFIPLFASLLIPFLATWMNKAEEDGGFEVEAFELANVIIGGIFAVIALSFTFSSSYPAIAAEDNTVTRLIALNYVGLAVGLIITVTLYRYRLPARWFGPQVQQEFFIFLSWAFPFLFMATGLAMVMAAAA